MRTRLTTWRVWLLAFVLAGTGCVLHAQTESNQPSPTDVATEAPAASAATARVAPSESAGARGKLDYASFKIITERNIFNGNRSGQRITSTRSSSQQRSVRVDSFALVGTLFSSKTGPTAFFDGTDPSYHKAIKPGGTIAGFQINDILPAGVRLAEGTTEMDLCVGNGMRREEGGPWKLSTGSASYASGSSGSTSDIGGSYRSRSSGSSPSSNRNGSNYSNNDNNNASSGNKVSTAEVNEVLKRLMEKREKEAQ